MVRIALGLDADLPAGRFVARPAMAAIGGLRVDGLRLGEVGVCVHADPQEVRVSGLPAGVRSVEPSAGARGAQVTPPTSRPDG